MCEHSSRITNDCVDYQHSVNQNKAHTIHLTFVKLVIKSGMLAKRVPNGSMPARRGVRMGTLKSEMCTCGSLSKQRQLCDVFCTHRLALLLRCQPCIWRLPLPVCDAIWHQWPHGFRDCLGNTKLVHPCPATVLLVCLLAVVCLLCNKGRDATCTCQVLRTNSSMPRWAICGLVWKMVCLLSFLCVGRFADVITMFLSHIMVFVLNANHNIPYSTCSETLCCIRVSECASFEVV